MDQVERSVWCLGDKRIPMRVKDMFYKSVVKPTMLYGSECWVLDRKIKRTMSVAEMKMLRWMRVVTKRIG